MARLIQAFIFSLMLQAFGADLTWQRSFSVDYPASDLVFDGPRGQAYLINANTKEVQAVNLETGAVPRRYGFSTRPETMALRPDGKRLYVAMPTRAHDYSSGAFTGYVGEVNLELQEKTREFQVDLDPFGIIATDQGWIVIPSGSGQWTDVVSFNAATGARINARMIRHMSRIALHPNQTQFYTADTDVSPSDIDSWKLNPATGEIVSGVGAPYHGDYPMGGNVYVHPNGTNLVTAGGGVYTSSTEADKDMRYVTTLRGGTVRAISFDTQHGALFTAGPTSLSYYGVNFELVRQYPVADGIRYITASSNTLTLVTVKADRTVFDVYSNPAAGAETNSLPVPDFVWTPQSPTTTNLTTFDATGTTDDGGGTNLLFRWDFEADGTWERDFTNTPLAEVRYNIAGTKTVRLEVTDRFGGISRIEKSFNVPFAPDLGTPSGGNPAYQLTFRATDVAVDTNSLRLFATDSDARKLAVLNLTNGFVEREFSFVHTPEHLAVSPNGQNLYVTLVPRPHSPYWFSSHTGYVAQISLSTLTKVREVRVDIDPYKIVATDNGLLAITGGSDQSSQLSIVRAETGQVLGQTGLYMGATLALHPAQEAVYYGDTGLSPGDFYRVIFQPATGAVISTWDSPYHGDHPTGGQAFITPDSRYVIGQSGVVLSSSADRTLDLRFVRNLEEGGFSWLHFDPENDAFFTVGGNWNASATFRYYNENLELVRSEPVTNDVDRIFGTPSQLFLVARSSNRTTVYPRVNPAGAARLNQPPVAQFAFLPAGPTTVTPLTVDAGETTDDDLSTLQYRWDWEADGTYDIEFSTNKTATHRYFRPGTHTIRLQVKDNFGLLDEIEKTFQVVLEAFPGIPYGPAPNEPFKIPYRIVAAAFDPLQPRVFVIPAETKNIEVIDLSTGYLDRQYIFEINPVSIAITPNGKRMYVAFSKGHEYWTGGKPHIGRVAEFDLERMVLTREMELPIDPADIVATDAGYLIISDGSDQWTELAVFKAETGEKIGSSGIYMGMQLALHPSQRIVYGTDVALSPSDIHHFGLSPSGAITDRWESPYHGDYPLGQEVFAFPDGSGVFSMSGTVLTSTTVQSTDLRYVRSLGIPPTRSVAFDTNKNVMVSTGPDSLTFYNYRSNLLLQTRRVAGAQFTGMRDGRAAVISVFDGLLGVPGEPRSEIQFFRIPASTPAENLPPTVSLRLTGTNSVVTAGSSIEAIAESRDEDGSIFAVNVFRGTNTVAIGTNDTLLFSTVVHPGTNEFYALVYDNFEAAATSTVLRVIGNLPPAVRFIQPSADTTFNALEPVPVQFEATDQDGTVVEVRFAVNGNVIATDTTAPYEFQFTPANAGRYAISAEAQDDRGATASRSLVLHFGGGLDNWASTMEVLEGANLTQNSSTLNATRQKGEALHAGLPGGRSLWWAWRAPGNGTATIETRGSNFDTLLAVYLAGTPATSLTNLILVAASDDDSLIAPASRVKFTTVKSQVYYIAVDGRDGVAGNAQLSIRYSGLNTPENDPFAGAIILSSSGTTQERSSVGATKESGEPDHAGNRGGASLWWRFDNSVSTAPIQITTVGSRFDTVLAVYTNVPQKGLIAMADLRPVVSNDDGIPGTNTSLVTFIPRSYQTYWIAVDGYNGAEGTVRIRLTRPGQEPVIRPPNDNFASAHLLSGNSVLTNAYTRWATRQGGEPQHAGRPGTASVWYRWTASADGPVYLSTKGSGFDTLLAVYTGTNLLTLTAVASNDDDPAASGTSALVFNAGAGTEYQIAVDGYQNATGNLVLTLNQVQLSLPRLVSQWTQGTLALQIQGSTGNFILESSSDLLNWQPVTNATQGETFEVESMRSTSRQFYRVRLNE